MASTAFGCATQEREGHSANEVVVAAAANFSEAFEELGKRFTARTGVRVILSFGATAQLAQQIESGAPFDVFASADVRHMDELANKGLLAEDSRALFARGSLVLWLLHTKDGGINQLGDLAGAQISKIAIAKPELAPYGQAAVEALRASNLWPQVEPKVVYAPNVAQAKQFASTGNADAAFIPRSLVKAGEGKAIEVDEQLHQPLDHAIAIVRSSRKQTEARQFVDFVLSVEGQAVLESYGYRKPINKAGGTGIKQ
ncbi:MAG: molybdate ABC transporter substrate-binding protein [Acidobacteria bacterium]|nr:molybdate ABC transporter substrate-binding protein [Acidobacteriota bacterium]